MMMLAPVFFFGIFLLPALVAGEVGLLLAVLSAFLFIISMASAGW